ncbi:MAG: prepilin-type N-terminal cleavage/methylation domain-containing protein [Candidatus Taylorbacteria bacterium]
MIRTRKYNKGFTLIELLVCMIIFVIMTALLVVKYGNFSQNILVTNIAYDTALAIRTAQNYGLSVKTSAVVGSLDCSSGSGSVGDEGKFQCSYGVEFDTNSSPKSFKTFVHKPLQSENGQYSSDNRDLSMATYNLRSNATISGYCFTDTGCTPDVSGKLDILFRRPDPAAMIYFDGDTTPRPYVKITIQGSDGTKRYISIRSNGQISVDI